ncbi:Nramp family divalent metal transporter [Candidatus Woesebacteria bacterium]|nr:MAG: Nramp family divalent metal transporter [Candidatus Woesebacteria bacterium]
MSKLNPLLIHKELPNPWPLKKLIGPSFIILGVGLGSGELILWPYLTSNFGLGIMWAAALGITFQFFLNMEIERYSLITGESIFVGLTRKYGRFTPLWFILTTLIPWMWPGIIASSATVLAYAMGIEYAAWIGISLLILQGFLYSLGHVIYNTQENIQKTIILVGVPFIFLLTLYFADTTSLKFLLSGLIGRGEGFVFLPKGIPIATFLAALAYAGAGGNLNLAQSLYVKEKGYGMGKFSGRITSLFKGSKENITLEGTTFEITPQNMLKFKIWWKRINIEHITVFWFTGLMTMIMLSLLSYVTVFHNPDVVTSINFVIQESVVIAHKTFPFLGNFFLIMAAIMLFGTQFSVYGSNARIASENLVILNKEKFKINNLPKYFYVFLWLQIAAGIWILGSGFTEPLTLVVTGAVLNAFSMFIYSGLILWLNLTSLAKPLRPGFIRIFFVGLAFVFYGSFSAYTIYLNITKFI